MRTLVLLVVAYVVTLVLGLIYFVLAKQPLTHDFLVSILAVTPVTACAMACIYNAIIDI